MATAVDVRGVSKRFRLYHEKYTSLKERIIHAGKIPYEDLWALRDVAFSVEEGETVGILGRNGSGKSTLLKCVCGVLQPTSGEVVVRGKLAGLLELGAGMQPDLSGRENIYLNGSMLGLAKRDVDRMFDDIVEFAELGQFIDNQVKFYSSGMYVRLGFAVAVNVDPDVLVIDEVLAVGDERFQKKCMDRIKQFQREGRTILFVSHAPDQVRAICDRAVVLADGQMAGLGDPGDAVRLFRERLLEAGDVLGAQAVAAAVEPEPTATAALASQTDERRPVRIGEVALSFPGKAVRSYLLPGEPMTVMVGYEAAREVPEAVVKIEVREHDGDEALFATDTEVLGVPCDLRAGSGAVELSFDDVPFLEGTYEVNVGILTKKGMSDWHEPACQFQVVNPERSTGSVRMTVRVALKADDGADDRPSDDPAAVPALEA